MQQRFTLLWHACALIQHTQHLPVASRQARQRWSDNKGQRPAFSRQPVAVITCIAQPGLHECLGLAAIAHLDTHLVIPAIEDQPRSTERYRPLRRDAACQKHHHQQPAHLNNHAHWQTTLIRS
ncbi:hypothetical protein ALP29_201114 [Pseudomonas syringae pv. avii]|uniref:Uncharacterized protein n=1 Tax=Pseudomonas syringae pv. avii TaxID=663959 RepID=A0A3M5W4E2_PSESX|nr:hypothetical protein ALP29_201114 [Pseudomonas syringae pv. avii]